VLEEIQEALCKKDTFPVCSAITPCVPSQLTKHDCKGSELTYSLSDFCRLQVWAIILSHFAHNWGTFILLTWMPSYYSQVSVHKM
jgi:hypothetical protein